MKKIITIFVLICGMAVVGCSKPQGESIPLPIQPADTLEQPLSQYKMSYHDVNRTIVNGKLIVCKRNVFRDCKSVEKAVGIQYETSNDIAVKLICLIKEVATRCGQEIDKDLENKIYKATEKELFQIIHPQLVSLKFGDPHILDERGTVTADIRYYYEVEMQQPIAPVTKWLLAIASKEQRPAMQKIINEIFKIEQ